MISPKALQAWFTLVSEAMQGTEEAQQALKSLSEMSTHPQELQRWMAKFMPAVPAAASPPPEDFEAWLEEWWRMMGVVPRARYLELLEKYDSLQRRLERAEETIQKLKTLLDSKGHQEEDAQKVLDMWSSMLEETLKTQTEWMKAWTAANQPSGDAPQDTDAAAPDQGKPASKKADQAG